MSKSDRFLRVWEIESITTAMPGWRAVYVSRNEPGGYFEVPIACWAVLRFSHGSYHGWDKASRPIWDDEPVVEREVHGMTIEEGRLRPVEADDPMSGNFWGMLAPGEGIERLGPAPSVRS